MINRKGEEFSSFVKLDLASGRPQYSRTPDGFNERQAPTIPAEVYGHLLSAQERANLQDGKAILVTGMKGPNGKPFDSLSMTSGDGTQDIAHFIYYRKFLVLIICHYLLL